MPNVSEIKLELSILSRANNDTNPLVIADLIKAFGEDARIAGLSACRAEMEHRNKLIDLADSVGDYERAFEIENEVAWFLRLARYLKVVV